MSSKNIVFIIVASFAVMVGVAMLMFRTGGVSESTPQYDLLEGARNIKGEGDITIVEFSDFQCPACAASQEELKRIMSEYEGRIKLVYRHFPLNSIHPYAEKAAVAAEAAGEQGKFFEYHDVLFERQSEWVEGGVEDKFVSYAKELELDVEKFTRDMSLSEVRDRVLSDLLLSQKLRLTGTPSFFVNNEKVTLPEIEGKINQYSQ